MNKHELFLKAIELCRKSAYDRLSQAQFADYLNIKRPTFQYYFGNMDEFRIRIENHAVENEIVEIVIHMIATGRLKRLTNSLCDKCVTYLRGL